MDQRLIEESIERVKHLNVDTSHVLGDWSVDVLGRHHVTCSCGVTFMVRPDGSIRSYSPSGNVVTTTNERKEE